MTKRTIVFIADTHGSHEELIVPNGDILFHCGDFSATGSVLDVLKFNSWLGTLPHELKICIAGNHDGFMESHNLGRNLITNAVYLENELLEYEGLRIWGSPITPEFNNWFFMRKRGDDITKVWEQIPDKIDILLTHGPCYGILDTVKRSVGEEHLGCWDLRERVKQLKNLKIHAFGHLHGAYGIVKIDRTKFINCSSMDDNYDIVNKPIVVRL
jgi:Icc-related predicted phosphoesterase